MAHATKDRNEGAGVKIRALLLGGQSVTPQQAARQVAESFATEIEGTLRGQAPGLATQEIHAAVRGVLERGLCAMFVPDEQAHGSHSAQLPVTNLRPSDVIEKRKVRMSLASLYRSVEASKFYCVVPAGQTNGREFPAWQFADPVPELLPAVLLALQGALRTEVHAFLVTSEDALNELAPAEVLAGAPFETRTSLHSSQQRLMQLPAGERQRKVLALINGSGKSMAA
ncbi:MAG: hypothetical protein AB1704_19960 [Pseudomonadota bacterium]